jgi:hypothetical protein
MSLTNSGALDGRESFDTLPTERRNGSMMYQTSALPVAAGRANAERTSPAHAERTFVDEIQLIARQLLFSTARATDEEKQFLRDVARQEGRYPLRALERLTEIAKKSGRPEHREALSRFIRERSTPATAANVSVAAIFDVETVANGDADLAQRIFERTPTRTNAERVIEKLHAQEIASREAIDAIRRAPLVR